jgi:Subtilase family/Domain of unknown function (DUF4114)/Bacterial SH3 domain
MASNLIGNSSDFPNNANNSLNKQLANTSNYHLPITTDKSNPFNINKYLKTSSNNFVIQSASLGTELSVNSANTNPPFTSGWYTVGDKGEVSFDFLVDDGAYQGELGVFNMEGMGQYKVGSSAFIQEAARRALSSSTLGYVVISDVIEGARFSGTFDWDENYNVGDYLGIKTFNMNPNSQFAIIFVPNGKVQEVFNNPLIDGDKSPLFSLEPSSTITGFHSLQLADVTNRNHVFAMEDLRKDIESDRDYNDIIFEVRGAKGKAPSLDNLIDNTKDWRKSIMGKNLLEHLKPPVNQPFVGVIDTGLNDSNLGINPLQIYLGKDYVGSDGISLLEPGENDEHGTHIVGIIKTIQNYNIGINGVQDNAPIYVARTIGSGKWAQALIDFVDVTKESAQKNAVANLAFDLVQLNPNSSVTTRYELTPIERKALEYARQNYVLVVAAAGNDSGVISALGQASQEFDNVITVGAADSLNLAPYSNFGYGLNLLAPGGTIENPVLSTVKDTIGTMTGTSVATAYVTGTVARLWAENSDLSYRQIIEILENSAKDLNIPGWDMKTGWGLLDIPAAIKLAIETKPQSYIPEPFSIPTSWSNEENFVPMERAANFYGTTENKIAVKINQGVNIRSGPGRTEYQKIGKISADTRLEFDTETQGELVIDPNGEGSSNTWYRLTDARGWMSALYVRKVQQLPQPNPKEEKVYTVDSSVNSVWNQYKDTLGNPTSYLQYNENGATYQLFANGSIISSQYGVFALSGDIRQSYVNIGGLNSWLGTPKSAEIERGNQVRIQYFAHGYIIWNGNRAIAYRNGVGQPITTSPTTKPKPIPMDDIENLNEEPYKLNNQSEDERGQNIKLWSREQKINRIIDHIKDYSIEYVKALGENALNDIISSFNEIIDSINKFPNVDWTNLGIKLFDFIAGKVLSKTLLGRVVLGIGGNKQPSDIIKDVASFIQNPDLVKLFQEVNKLWEDGIKTLQNLRSNINKLNGDFQNLPNSLDNIETEAELDKKAEHFVEVSTGPLLSMLADLIIGKIRSKFVNNNWAKNNREKNAKLRSTKTPTVSNFLGRKPGGTFNQQRYDVEIEIPASNFPNYSLHVATAQSAGKPIVLTVAQDGKNPKRRRRALRPYKYRQQKLGNIGVYGAKGQQAQKYYSGVDSTDMDEYPPAMFLEGGKGSSVFSIPSDENQEIGRLIYQNLKDGNFYKNGVKVKITPVFTLDANL